MNVPSKKDITKDLDFVKKVVIDNFLYSYIAKSSIHGFGLFAKQNINKGSILSILDGQIIDWDKYDQIKLNIKSYIESYENYFFMEWNALDAKTLLVRPFRTKYSYINHSYNPNLIIKYNPIRIESIVDIRKNDELFLNYKLEPLRKKYINGHGRTFL